MFVLDVYKRQARSKEGLLLTRYDPEDSLIDACNLGTAGCQLIEAYEQCERIGVRRTDVYKRQVLGYMIL